MQIRPGRDTLLPMLKTRVTYLAVCLLFFAAGIAVAQRPKEDVSGARHPNIAAAQRLVRQAWQRVVDAQQANEWDLAGHAQRAKELLNQADNELKAAAQASNRR
ncbi:MAG: hypothetical protein KGN36_18705 [Acidobacteriota bacterium]|nr:hypothetical protein [Acidobacteriota bacterium]